MSFYAFSYKDGNRKFDDNGYRIGYVVRFDKKSSRDAWCGYAEFSSTNASREALSPAEARHEMTHLVVDANSKTPMGKLWDEYYQKYQEVNEVA